METLIGGGAFFECPRWHDGRLWVSDFWRRHVLAVGMDGAAEVVAEVPGSPSGLGRLPDGSLLVVSMMDRKLLRVADGRTSVHADLSALTELPVNDLVTDAAGRAYLGTCDFSGAPAKLYRADPDGGVHEAADGMAFPNGPALTPDGRTLIVAESYANRLTAFDLAPDGALVNRRVWAELGTANPDGIALDAEGAVWVADAGGNRAIRVREGGEITQEISTGDDGVFACALGGPDGHTLFLCTAPTYDPGEAARILKAEIRTIRVDVPA
ncbi:SMP-30/gluconolactonase/LRE family protein [Nonomuraea sp. NPDC050790]|uniref:SMP-30/gluconolactonase/LRE family protein n=1 Tax=Nonomuraea sp. NPDC050790 TaxID=3364371 RepID=UPI0037AF087F